MKAFSPPLRLTFPSIVVLLFIVCALQQWPMYMVDYSGVNVQVPGKVNYWRTNLDCSKGIKGVCQSDIHDSSTCDTNFVRVLRLNNLSRLSTESWRFDSEWRPECWGTTECMWIENVAGRKAWLVFCLLPPRSASRTAVSFCSTSKTDHDRYLVFTKLKSCYLPLQLPSVHPLSEVVGCSI